MERESGRKAQLSNITAAKVSLFFYLFDSELSIFHRL